MRQTLARQIRRNIIPPTILSAAVLIAFIISRQWQFSLIALILGIAWVGLSWQFLATRSYLYKIHTPVKQTNEKLVNTTSLIQEIVDGNQETANNIARVERRLIRMDGTLGNVSGSVGKAAPRIRRVEAAINHVTVGDRSSTAASSTTKPVQKTNKPQPSKHNHQFPPVKPHSAIPNFKDVRVAVIADEFTAKAFGYEWSTFEPTPNNWRQLIDEQSPDFLFVESAWEANDGSWRYHLVGVTAPRPAIIELVAYCKQREIPTVFWNKEDPPHFEEFLPTASLFDYIYTTDGNLIAEYKKRLGHNRVGLLPFAAQPKIHNPARVERLTRNREIVFGGMYFREKYPERRDQLDIILPAAAKFGLDIYSRQDGSDIKYRFPEEYQSLVRGSLPYQQMLTAYHVYKAVINVNSVTNSDTMCARRIFEATACGAAVITTPSRAVARFFPNGLLTEVENEEQAFHRVRTLVRSDEVRERLVHKAQRHIWENHTYAHRAHQIMGDLGVEASSEKKTVSFFVSTNRPENLELIFQNVSRQAVPNKELVILTHGFVAETNQYEELSTKYNIESLVTLSAPTTESLGSNLNKLTQACSGDILLRMDDDDYYGANYARDLTHALAFSGADLVGKAATYIYFEEMDSTVLTYEAHENRFTDFIRGATFCGPRETFLKYSFPELAKSEDSAFIAQILESGGRVYTADRFNFMVMRRADKSSHTWRVSDDQLFSSGTAKFFGCDPKQITV